MAWPHGPKEAKVLVYKKTSDDTNQPTDIYKYSSIGVISLYSI